MRRFWIADFGFGIGRGEMREVQGGSALSTFHLKPAPKRRSAFTLIELLGVMAIIGILSAVVLPPMIAKIEEANSVGEDANLEEIARALVAGIKATGTIPNPNLGPVSVPGDPPTWTAGSWTAIAANYCSLAGYSLLNTRPANNQRQIVLSAGLAAYIAQNGGSYATDADGWPAALGNDMEIYILSSTKDGVGLMSGIPAADIKNWSKIYNTTTGRVEVPATILGAGNTTKGEFLHVKTIDVRSLFCAVTLTDFPIPTGGQTISSGSGFTPNTSYQGQAAGCSFNFTAPAYDGAVVVGFNIAPIATPTAATGVAVGSKSQIQRSGATTTGLMGVIPPADRNIASLNARNTLAANLLSGPYAEASGAPNAAAALDAIRDADIDEDVNSTVPAPAGLTTLRNTYNSAKVASDAAQAAAEAEKIRDPANETDPDNSTLESTAAVTLQATASAKDALETAETYSSAQITANANALAAASANAKTAADAEFNSGGTPQSIASAAANAAANAAAAQVFTSPADFAINITQPPSWLIGALVQKQMPNAGNSQTFYVIKGTTLTLYADDLVQIPAPILTVQINADNKFEYFNRSWTRVD